MVTFAQLRDLDVAQLQSLGGLFSQLASRLSGRGDDFSQQMSTITGHWEGGATDSAKTTLESLLSEIDAAGAPLKEIDRVMSSVADDLQRAKGMLLDAIDAATKIPASISDDGTVTYTGPDVSDEQRAQIDEKTTKVTEDIRAALTLANRSDETGAAALSAFVPGFDPDDPTAGYVPESDIPSADTDPAEVNRWWKSLTWDQQQYLIHHYPELIGNLDGIPIMARDQANRAHLAQAMRDAEERRQHLLRFIATGYAGSHPGIATAVAMELHVIERNQAGMQAIADRLYNRGLAEPPAYLIGFMPGSLDGEAGDDGRAIIAIGNPDWADHVATFVPGTGASLEKIGEDIERADVMHRDARDLDPKADTAVIAWVGYDAPDDLFEAAFPDSAWDATDDLRQFQQGLEVTNRDGEIHRTVIGHSYGSTTMGIAAEDDMPAEDLVFVGSPGAGVTSAEQLGVEPGHVWSLRAANDPIAAVPAFGHFLPWFGADPDHIFFDSHKLPSEKVGHSGYWSDDASTARDGMAAVITGNYDMVPG